jgi:hypothetical protein
LLRAGRSGDQIPVTARFSAPVQTCFGVHPAPQLCQWNVSLGGNFAYTCTQAELH